ncbi:hypothetical protein L2X99_10885 [Microbacterium sp. KUDC0406]|uniref:hypothetical protein n=1 Tax=Microbacterium sp. KUDC0406 TaxID=2909588 RepID=UPI001F15DE56|nr:hypothetical protein [Microbacterium sp. KUDC0406]UJP08980.1 hypothetical protein L2X99_10885 [Microbacterium sp. KUDC0406]
MKKKTIREWVRPRRAVPALLLSGAMVATLGAGASATTNPPITTLNRTVIADIPDTYITSDGVTRRVGSVNGLYIVGDSDAYVLKSDHSGTDQTGWATFSHINDFNTSSAVKADYMVRLKGGTEPYSLGHANGLAYYRTPGTDYLEVGSFYVPTLEAPGEPQVAQINNQGEITKLFKARKGTSNKKIASIAYRGDGTWIVGTANESIPDPNDSNLIRRPYYIATIAGDYFELGNKFFVPTTKTFNLGQDIAYNPAKDQILIPVWDGKNTVGTATGLKNRIIFATLGTVTNNKVYTPVRWADLTVPASAATLFEFEGIALDSNGKLFVASNIVHPDGVTYIDRIHKLTGQ